MTRILFAITIALAVSAPQQREGLFVQLKKISGQWIVVAHRMTSVS